MKNLEAGEARILRSFEEHAISDGATVHNIGNLVSITWRDFDNDEFTLVFELHEATHK